MASIPLKDLIATAQVALEAADRLIGTVQGFCGDEAVELSLEHDERLLLDCQEVVIERSRLSNKRPSCDSLDLTDSDDESESDESELQSDTATSDDEASGVDLHFSSRRRLCKERAAFAAACQAMDAVLRREPAARHREWLNRGILILLHSPHTTASNFDKKMLQENRKRVYSEEVELSVRNPQFFQRLYRVHNDDFFDLLGKISPALPRARSDSCPHLLYLAATLRFLAGGSYLDISRRYYIPVGSLYPVFRIVVEAIDANLDNITFPQHACDDGHPEQHNDLVRLQKITNGFDALSGGKFSGTVAAGDGIVIKIRRPPMEVCSFICDRNFPFQFFCFGSLS